MNRGHPHHGNRTNLIGQFATGSENFRQHVLFSYYNNVIDNYTNLYRRNSWGVGT